MDSNDCFHVITRQSNSAVYGTTLTIKAVRPAFTHLNLCLLFCAILARFCFICFPSVGSLVHCLGVLHDF